jgi:hypothetical protein
MAELVRLEDDAQEQRGIWTVTAEEIFDGVARYIRNPLFLAALYLLIQKFGRVH